MKKHPYRMICIFCVLTLILSELPVRTGSAASSRQTGVTLDCARRYYTVSDIQKYIRLISDSRHPFLHLHLTDNQNIGLECISLGQTIKKSHKQSDGSYKNPKTGKKFLSRNQIRHLIHYASARGVEVIPEIDMPAHMNGFFRLAELKKGKRYVRSITKDKVRYPGELNIRSKRGLDFAKMLYQEYASLFSECKYFHMGCDELASGSDKDILSFINSFSRFLNKKGYTVRIWNDFITKKNIKKLNAKLQVTYWSLDGDTQNAAERKKRRKNRASVPDLQKAGIYTLIYNSYYLYYTPSKSNSSKADRDYMASDLKKNWDLKNWDGRKRNRLSHTTYILGASVSIWGEDAKGLSSDQIYRQIKPLITELKKKIN